MIVDIAIRNQFHCSQKWIISIKMLFPVYFFNDDTMNTPNPDKPEQNRDKAKINH